MEQASREMTLSEYINALHPGHPAQAEYLTILDTLQWCSEMCLARDRMNAKTNCAPLKLSPITVRVFQSLKRELPSE